MCSTDILNFKLCSKEKKMVGVWLNYIHFGSIRVRLHIDQKAKGKLKTKPYVTGFVVLLFEIKMLLS